jgi:tetratricopeptide (TPR) repeat protein
MQYRGWIFLTLGFVLSGCATSAWKNLKESTSHLPKTAQVTNVPVIEQTSHFCGPAALAMALQWTGEKNVSIDRLATQVYTPELQGTLQNDMLAGARRHGKLAMVLSRQKDVFEEVAQGHPVVVLQNLGLSWYPRWHYAVVTGYNLQKDEVYLHSGENKVTTLPLDTFYNTWNRAKNWSLLILPTDALPVSQREQDITAAAVALEVTAGAQAAEPAYQQILKKWPKSIGARFGLANTRYALHDKTSAVRELQILVKDYPKLSPAWHNLSLILKEQKKIKEADFAALKAQETASEKEREKYKTQYLQH